MATSKDAGLKSAVRAASAVVFLTAFTAACDRQVPRTFNDFMEDPIARDGAIARCNQDRDASVNDVECAHARRAAAAVAVREERERSAALEAESERKLRALRLQAERAEEAARLAAEAAAAKERAEYEARFTDQQADGAQSAAAAGAPQQAPASVDTVVELAAPTQAPPPSNDLLQRARQRPSELASSPVGGTSAAEPSTADADDAEPGIVPRPFREASGATP